VTLVQTKFVTIDESHAGQRIDNFLVTQLKGVPHSRIYRALRKGEVRVNKGRVQAVYKLKLNDVVRLPPLRVSETEVIKPSARLSDILKQSIIFENDEVDKRTSDSYYLTAKINLDNFLIDYLTIEPYFKEYSTTDYGKTRGINFSFGKDDIFSYKLNGSIGRSEFNNQPLIRSVDKTLNLLTSYEISETWLAFLKFTLQDGYWTDKTFSGNVEKLGTAKSITLGASKTLSLFNKDDLSVSLGVYIPDAPLFNLYNGKTIYSPPAGTLQVTYTY